jgi:serine/threonine-protein kinase
LTGLNDDDDTRAASVSDETAAAPTDHATELIETAAASTPELAWSDDTEDQETDTVSEKRSRALWLVPVTALLVAAIAVASALLFYTHRAPATSTRAPAAPSLDGTYRLDYDFAKATYNGVPAPQPNTNNTGWWAFRSSCTTNAACVATGTKLDKNNPRLASTPSTTAVFRFVNGHWQAAPYRRQSPFPSPCLGANGDVVATGENSLVETLLMDPKPDGRLQGVQTYTTVSNECGSQGQVPAAPFVAKRTGDLPLGVSVADPATVATSPATSTSTYSPVAGQALDGTFRLDFDYAKQTVNGVTVINPPRNDSTWWAFRSVCTNGCVATGVGLASENPTMKDGMVRATEVLRFTDGRWQDITHLLPPAKCPGEASGTVTNLETVSWSWEAQPDGTLHGTQTMTVLTNECGNQGAVRRTPVSATRTGDVPPTVVLADPGLF